MEDHPGAGRLPRAPSLSFLVGAPSAASAGGHVMWPVSAWAAFASWRPSAAAAAMIGELLGRRDGRPAYLLMLIAVIIIVISL